MPRNWSPEQAASLAPDPASLKAGQGLATPRKWSALGRDERFLWGLAQGSGKDPYQSQIDLDEPAFKCSCPSRKFPCKHGLGLLLLHASQGVAEGPRPPWVEEWAAKRAERVAKAEAKSAAAASQANGATPAPAADPEAQARRREKRAANVATGLGLLEAWLRDLARQGTAAAKAWPPGVWDDYARRLVDAQAPALARRVRLLGGLAALPDSTEFLDALGRLHLLTTAATRRAQLPAEWQAEIDALVGWTVDQEELRTQAGEQAVWFAAAQEVSEDAGVITRATHLFAPGKPPALILEFSHGSHASTSALALGRAFSAELVRFPGVAPERALLKGSPADAARPALSFVDTLEALLSTHCERLAANPWREELPALVRLTPQVSGEVWSLVDAAGMRLPLAPSFARGWELLACSGGSPLRLCGLWNGRTFRPLSLITAEGSTSLTS